MSQRTFKVRDGVECMVGWDEPMETFFGQVYKVDETGNRVAAEDGGNLLWVGGRMGVIRTVSDLSRELRPQKVTIPPDIYRELHTIEVD